MNILKKLKKEHREVAKLFKQIKKTAEENHDKKVRLFLEIKQKLSVHAESEEQVLYTSMKRHPKSRAEIFEAYEEHGLLKKLLSEIEALWPTDERWQAKLTVLNEMVDHHVKEEERDLFKEVREYYGRAELEEMGARYVAQSQTVLKSLGANKVLRTTQRKRPVAKVATGLRKKLSRREAVKSANV